MGEEESKEVRITYETLFEMFRTEKNRPELQKIPDTFFKDLVEYLLEKKRILEESETKTGLFVAEEKERTEKQIANIKKLLIGLYEKREKKIINLAIDKSRMKSDLIDTSSLLAEETGLFEQLIGILDNQRNGVLLNILEAKVPFTEESKPEVEETSEQKTEEPSAEERKELEEQEIKKEELAEKPIEIETKKEEIESELKEPAEQEIKEPEKQEIKPKPDTRLIRFVYAVPKFIGKELETYGPFEEEDIATLPAEIADVLIAKGRVEEIEEG